MAGAPPRRIGRTELMRKTGRPPPYNRVTWVLANAETGATIKTASDCVSTLVPNVPAGNYQLTVSRDGYTGMHAVSIALM
jgi:hypothetical protein